MVTEISPDVSRWDRLKRISIEWLSVIISCVAVFVALMGHFESVRANVRSEMYKDRVGELEEQIAVLGIRVAKWQAYAEAHELGE